jgi:hypothetical protein
MTAGGDPNGKRLARRRAILLAEAGRIGHALKALLRRADFGTGTIDTLAEAMQREEMRQLQLGYGKIESRKRFGKHAAQPILDHRVISELFLDESGNSAAEPLPGPTFFALAGIAMEQDAAKDYRIAADRIKMEFFGRTGLTFHEAEMREYDGPYYFDGDQDRQREFDQAIDKLILDAEFVAFGVGIRKRAFEKEFVEAGIDPYLPTDAYAVAITMLLERYLDYLATQAPDRLGRLTFEAQGSREDAAHQLEYARLLLDGSQWIPDSVFRNWLETGLRFTPKMGSHGTELADMFSRELYEWIKGDCDVTPKRWPLFSRKIYYREDGAMGKFGVKVFPDGDIRHYVLDHRRRCGTTV